MAERPVALGHMIVGLQSAAGTPVTPGVAIPYYKESLTTDPSFVKLNPAMGNKFETFKIMRGMRKHRGNVTVLFEPNTAGHLLNMLYTKGAPSGAGPYTHPFTANGDSAFYTIDLSTVSQVFRFWGVAASSLKPGWNENEAQAELALSALGSFAGREIATISTITLTLKTDYDPVPNKGLVVGDLVTITKADNSSTLNTTIASVNADGITITLGTSAAAYSAGDMITLRPQTPTLTLLDSFELARTYIGYGATASAALTAAVLATQTRVDQLDFELRHGFNKEDGEQRSGGYDPASLVRTRSGFDHKIKKFHDTPEELQRYNAMTKRACVIRMLSGSTNQYELRITLNNLVTGNPKPESESDGIFMSDLEFLGAYDSSDAQGMDVKVINNLATIA